MRPIVLALCILSLAGAPAAADDVLITRTYDVGVLTRADEEPSPPALGLLPLGSVFQPMEVRQDEPLPPFTQDALTTLLEAEMPELWDAGEAAFVFHGPRLLVTAGSKDHARIEAWLARVWREAVGRIALEAHWVELSPDAVGRLASTGLLRDLKRGRVDTDGLSSVLEEGRGPHCHVSSATGLVRSGSRTVLGQTDAFSYVSDYDLEIAMDSVVGNPIVSIAQGGWSAQVRPAVLQDGSVRLEVVVQVARFDPDVQHLPLEVTPLGTVDLPRSRVVRFRSVARLSKGQHLACVARSPGEGGRMGVLLVGARAPRAGPTGTAFRRFDVASLTTAPTAIVLREGLSWTPRLQQGALSPPVPVLMPDPQPVLAVDGVVELVTRSLPADAWELDGRWIGAEGHGLVVRHEAEILEQAGDVVGALERDLLKTYRLHLRVRARGGAEDGKELAAAFLDVPVAQPVFWMAGVERAYVADWDVEVAQEARGGDPAIGVVFGGLSVNLRADPAPVPGHAALTLELRYDRLAASLPIRRLHNECTGIVQIPRVHRVDLSQDLVLVEGKPTLFDGGTLEGAVRLEIEVLLDPAP